MPEVTVQDLIRQTATGLGVPPELALAVAEQESGFNPTVVGPEITTKSGKTRAIGTFQLLPETAKGLGIDPSDPQQNIVGGVRYLRQLLDQHEGDLDKVLRTYGGVVNDTAYVPSVMARLSKFQQPTTQPVQGTQPAPAGRAGGAGPLGAPAGPAGPGGRTTGPGPGPAPGSISARFAPEEAVAEAVSAFNPMEPEGRQNIAASAGAIGATALTRNIPIVPWIARLIAGPLGAAFGGAAAEATEEALGSQPTTPGAIQSAALQQGAYEAAGQTFMWPIKHLFKIAATPGIAKTAREALNARLGRAVETTKQQSAASRMAGQDLVEVTKAVGKAQVEAAKVAGLTATRESKKAAAGRLAQVELDNAALLAGARAQYDNLLAQPPSTQGAAGVVTDVLQGPAKRALDIAGERVATTAATGPEIAMQPIKDALQEITSKFRPDSIFGVVDEAASNPLGFAIGPGSQAKLVAQYGSMEAATKQLAGALNLPDTHPLPGILGKVQSAPDQITFADAHKLKMLLDEAVNWDQVAKRHLEKITKGVRTVLREQLGGYEPYNTATAAYEAVIPLYRYGVGKQIARATLNDPDKIARTLKPDEPAKALALKNLLVDQSAAGGDAAMGQEAWDAVRASFTHEYVIKGGVEGLQDRLQTLLVENPVFAKTVYGDRTALQVLSNLDAIGAAYKSAVGTADTLVAATKDANKSAEQIVRDTVAKTIREARVESAAKTAGARRSKAEAAAEFGKVARAGIESAKTAQRQFAESSVGRASSTNFMSGEATDAARAVMLGPGSKWGLYSLIRLLRGPKSDDLLQYVSHSPALTQNVVQVMLGQAPERTVSDTMRAVMAVLSPDMPDPMASHSTTPMEAPVGSAVTPATPAAALAQ